MTISRRALKEQINGIDIDMSIYAMQYCLNDKNFKIAHGFTSRMMESSIKNFRRAKNVIDYRLRILKEVAIITHEEGICN